MCVIKIVNKNHQYNVRDILIYVFRGSIQMAKRWNNVDSTLNKMAKHYVNVPFFLTMCGKLFWSRPGSGHIILKTDAQTITKTCLYNFDPIKPHF